MEITTLRCRSIFSLDCIALLWIFCFTNISGRSIPPMYPPGQRPPPWFVPSDPNHQPQATWRPPGGVPHDQWVRCHGMACDEWRRTEEKVTRLIGSTNPFIGANAASGFLLDTRNGSLDGCIYLTEHQVDMLMETMSVTKQNDVPQIETRKLVDLEKQYSQKWTKFPIKYKFDGKHSSQEKQIIRNAFKSWMDNTCITFEEVDTNTDVTENHILLTAERTGCHSYVGKVSLIPQQLNLQSSCLWEFGIPVHEIGHILGMWHEQQRWDRDQYIRVLYDNVGYYSAQFAKFPTVSYGVPYDYGSVLHYAPKDGSKNGEITMEALDPLYQSSMGQRSDLSFFDAMIVNRAYCENVCSYQLPQPCQRGGYQDPKDCSKCKCPDGFGGTYCDQSAPPVNAQCGGDTLLYPGFSKEIQSPGYSTSSIGFYSDFQQCSWRIWTLATHRIQLEFDSYFGIYCHAQEQCYHWVEVKYESNFTLPGPRFCCYKAPQTKLISSTNEMVIIFSSNYSTFWDSSKIGFKATLTTVSSDGIPGPGVSPTTTTTTTTTTSTTTKPEPTTTTTTTTPRPVTQTGRWSWFCDFESPYFNREFSWCELAQESSGLDVFNWTITDRSTPSDYTGPDQAYAGRYYVYMEASFPRQRYDNVIIWLPRFWRSGTHCLRFYFHMHGYHVESLSVIIDKGGSNLNRVWSKEGDQGNFWVFAQVYIDLDQNDRIGFEAVRGREYSGDIAVDNIQLIQGFC